MQVGVKIDGYLGSWRSLNTRSVNDQYSMLILDLYLPCKAMAHINKLVQTIKEQKTERAMAQESGKLDKNLWSYEFFSIWCTIVGVHHSYITIHRSYNACTSFILFLNYLYITFTLYTSLICSPYMCISWINGCLHRSYIAYIAIHHLHITCIIIDIAYKLVIYHLYIIYLTYTCSRLT